MPQEESLVSSTDKIKNTQNTYTDVNQMPIIGLLEKPSVPPSFNQVFYKLAVIGKSGVGKTALVCLLSNQKDLVASSQIPPGETPGVRVTTIYWPAKINRSHIFLFQLDFWDSGETASKKYNHILPVRFK